MRYAPISRRDVDADIVGFLQSLPGQVQEMGFHCEPPEDVRTLAFYAEVMRLYEYAIEGVAPSDSDDGGAGDLWDLMIYLDALTEAGHSAELGRYGMAHPPAVAMRLANVAHARHNLDTADNGPLSIGEVALLARMDEKSVRNATNESAADRLAVVKQGAGVTVPIEEARRWLSGRKGFVPTRTALTNSGQSLKAAPLVLSGDVANLLRARASSLRVDVETFIRQTFAEAQ